MKKTYVNTYQILGKQLHCAHCGGADFRRGEAQLNTSGMSFMGLDFLNNSADTFICTGCGRIEWFLNAKVEVGTNRARHTGKSICLQCREPMPAGEAQCRKCGWTYMAPPQSTPIPINDG